MSRKAGHVHFVDNRRCKAATKRRVALPIVSGEVDHHAFHRNRVALPVFARALPTVQLGQDDGPPIGIEQNFAWIETQAAPGIERTESAIRIDLADPDSRHETVPVMIGAMRARIEVNH
jgi:hypothetical protein